MILKGLMFRLSLAALAATSLFPACLSQTTATIASTGGGSVQASVVVLEDGKPKSGLAAADFELRPSGARVAGVEERSASWQRLEWQSVRPLQGTNIISPEGGPRRFIALILNEQQLEMSDAKKKTLRRDIVTAAIEQLLAGHLCAFGAINDRGLLLVFDGISDPTPLYASVRETAKELGLDPGLAPRLAVTVPSDPGTAARLRLFLRGPETKPVRGERTGTLSYPNVQGFGIESLPRLEQLANRIGGIPGRKAVIWISSYPSLVLGNDGTAQEEITMGGGPIGGGFFQLERAVVAPATRDATLEAFYLLGITNVAIYSLRAGDYPPIRSSRRSPWENIAPALSPAETDRNLARLAFFGGGRPLEGDLSSAIAAVMPEISAFYEVGIEGLGPTPTAITTRRKGAVIMAPLLRSADSHVIHEARDALSNVALLPGCAAQMTGLAFAARVSAPVGPSELLVALPGTDFTSIRGDARLTLLATPLDAKGEALINSAVSQQVNGSAPATGAPVRLRIAMSLPDSAAALCVVVRDDRSGRVGSTSIPLKNNGPSATTATYPAGWVQ